MKDQELSMGTYYKRFSLLLHIEELQMEVDIRKYDMENAVMKKVNQKLLELQVSLNVKSILHLYLNGT